MAKINEETFERLNHAARMIEADACQAFQTTSRKYGTEVAAALCILFLRLQLNKEQRWPAPEWIEDRIKEVMKEDGVLE